MRVECTHCQVLVEIAGLSAVSGGLGFRCENCGGVTVLAGLVPAPVEVAPPVVETTPAEGPAPRTAGAPAEPRPRAAPAPAVPAGYAPCPKCGALHPETGPGAEHCARCGLVFSKVAAGEARLPPPPAVAPALRGRWRQLEDRLDDTDAHFAFIEACGIQNALEFAGHCYRSLTPPGHAEDPRVAAFRDRVLRQATARVQMLVPPRQASPATEAKRSRALIAALALAFFVLILGVGYWYLTEMTNRVLLTP